MKSFIRSPVMEQTIEGQPVYTRVVWKGFFQVAMLERFKGSQGSPISLNLASREPHLPAAFFRPCTHPALMPSVLGIVS